jgi:hypothetical protein
MRDDEAREQGDPEAVADVVRGVGQVGDLDGDARVSPAAGKARLATARLPYPAGKSVNVWPSSSVIATWPRPASGCPAGRGA